jgi:mono/diheme cytochrome c family protein
VLAVAVAASACGAADTPERQLARGTERYAQECRSCHDVEGAIGVALSDRVIASYGNAQRLFDYLRVAMPYGAPGSLDEEAYWDLVAFLASNRGARALPAVVDGATAARVTLTPETATPAR